MGLGMACFACKCLHSILKVTHLSRGQKSRWCIAMQTGWPRGHQNISQKQSVPQLSKMRSIPNCWRIISTFHIRNKTKQICIYLEKSPNRFGSNEIKIRSKWTEIGLKKIISPKLLKKIKSLQKPQNHSWRSKLTKTANFAFLAVSQIFLTREKKSVWIAKLMRWRQVLHFYFFVGKKRSLWIPPTKMDNNKAYVNITTTSIACMSRMKNAAKLESKW